MISAQKFSVGIKNGLSLTSVTGRFEYDGIYGPYIVYNKIKYDGQVRWKFSKFKLNSSGYLKQVLGFIINYRLNENVLLQCELNYEEKGFDFIYLIYGGGLYGYYKLNYFTFPISFTYEIGKSAKFYLYQGLSMNLLLQANNHTTRSKETGAPLEYITYDESYKPTEFNKKELGALLGAGIKIPVRDKAKFIIDTRYNFGITRAAENSLYPKAPNTFQNFFNRSITLCWGVVFSINKKKE